MRIIMMGTGGFAVPTYRALLDAGHDIPLVVTRPERPGPGKRKPPPNPMRQAALEAGVLLDDPESVNDAGFVRRLEELAADLLVVCDYGQILKREALSAARLGGLNLHGSLLPKYRGAAPVNWAIYHGEQESGVTVIHMTPRLDAGPCVGVAKTPIDADEDAVQLETRLAALGAPLVGRCVEQIAAGTATAIEQDETLASRAPRLRKADGEIDWGRSAKQIRNQIRALKPWPKTFTAWLREGSTPLRLILDAAEVVNMEQPVPPGSVLGADGEQLIVATGENALAVRGIQPAGKKLMATEQFLRGYPVKLGDRFGSQNAAMS